MIKMETIKDVCEKAQAHLQHLIGAGHPNFCDDNCTSMSYAVPASSIIPDLESERYGGGVTSDFKIYIDCDGVAFVFDTLWII